MSNKMFESMAETRTNTARNMSSLWRYITIDDLGNTVRHPIMAQDDILRMFPEIDPLFFPNFGVVEMVIRQENGTQLILKKVR